MSIKVSVTYKGKPFDPEEWKKDVKKRVMSNVIQMYENKIINALTEEELKQITVNFNDEGDGRLICEIIGPQDIAKKAQDSLSQ